MLVGDHRRCSGRREAAVQALDVPLPSGLAEDGRGGYPEAGERVDDREGLGNVADHDGDPPGLASVSFVTSQ